MCHYLEPTVRLKIENKVQSSQSTFGTHNCSSAVTYPIEYRNDDVTKISFWNFKNLTMWSERAPYTRHASKVSDK